MQWIIIATAISYFLGSIPTAYIFGRLLKGIDIRQHGSGNVGATNALRVLGKGPGITVLLLDILKGVAAVTLAGNLAVSRGTYLSAEQVRIALGMVAIIGHNWTIFLQFKGGKGIATTLGVLIGLAVSFPNLIIVISLVVAAWLVIFIITRIVSISSILAGISLPIFMVCFGMSRTLIFTSIILAAFVLLRHKANILRLLKGTEPRLHFSKSK